MPGYKQFAQTEILEAPDVNDYLMLQSIMVFANEIERNTQLIGSLRPGIFAYLANTNKIEFYNGNSWIRVAEYELIPGVGAVDEIRKVILMDSQDPETIEVTQTPLFYSIFSNYVDGTWTNNLW